MQHWSSLVGSTQHPASSTYRVTGPEGPAAASCDPELAEESGCLVTICSGRIVLRDSSVMGVLAIPTVDTLLCLRNDSRLEVYNSRFSNNRVRPFVVYDRAHLLLHASRVENNVGDGWGGGLYLQGDATAVITAGSSVQH
jgi:hypothetical protein